MLFSSYIQTAEDRAFYTIRWPNIALTDVIPAKFVSIAATAVMGKDYYPFIYI